MNLALRSRALAIKSSGAAFKFKPLVFVMAKHRKQIKPRDWEKKISCVHTTDCYAAVKEWGLHLSTAAE